MKKPLHATLTTPPLVEYVAVGRGDGWDAAGPAGGRTDPAPGTGVAVVGGESDGTGTSGGAVGDGGPAGPWGLGLPAAGPRPSAGAEVGAVAGAVVLVGVAPATDESGSSSLTTSWWARTAAGRSVTSAATMEVAVHTTTVDATVATSHSPMANTRGSCTSRGCLFAAAEGLREP